MGLRGFYHTAWLGLGWALLGWLGRVGWGGWVAGGGYDSSFAGLF